MKGVASSLEKAVEYVRIKSKKAKKAILMIHMKMVG
jgi:hypothetical protein